MNFGLFIFSIYTILICSGIFAVNCEVLKKHYMKYLINVVNHIRVQEGWYSMHHLSLNNKSSQQISIREAFIYNYGSDQLEVMFTNIIYLINVKYAEVLNKFVEFINIGTDHCEEYLIAQSFENFNICINLLEVEVKKSEYMFEHLYKAVSFLSYLDLKYIFTKRLGNPYVIVEEIYFVKNFISNLKLYNQLCDTNLLTNYTVDIMKAVITNIKQFIGEVANVVQGILNKLNIENNVPLKLKLILNTEYDMYKTDYSCFIDFLFKKLNDFYTFTIENDFIGLGFSELLDPITFNKKELYPPIDNKLHQETGIATLNKLQIEGNWQTLNHIHVLYYDQEVSMDQVLRNRVDNNNFHLKRKYFQLFLRCRFYELLCNYNIYLSVIIQECRKEKSHTKFLLNSYKFIECVHLLFLNVKSSQIFLNSMLIAMDKFKKLSVWCESEKKNSLNILFKLIEKFLKNLVEYNLNADAFVDSNDVNLMVKADKYLMDLCTAKRDFTFSINNLKLLQISRCITNENKIIEKNILLHSAEYNVSISNETTTSQNNIYKYHYLCSKLFMLCNNFITIEFNNLGFDKI
ncbi:uncharacterized protein LOC126906670 [Daktulosphaira vitifoliae]|uniref:uncharacterized protein LOC126906670 n=1 Tax=Daktulosphaira vitifoliae TaxID=58002 RepID=UPI0021AA1112|nr:uncharacterized protein LOC126906670 [Daktulosphaira vitifoliae]